MQFLCRRGKIIISGDWGGVGASRKEDGFLEEGRFNRGRCMMWVAKCLGRRRSSSKDPKVGRQGPVEKH